MGEHYFSISGKPVNLCRGHWTSFTARKRRGLSLPLIKGGHLVAANAAGYGNAVVRQDRKDYTRLARPEDFLPAWGWISYTGNPPDGLLDKVPMWEGLPAFFEHEPAT
jgi:hypothetical protein